MSGYLVNAKVNLDGAEGMGPEHGFEHQTVVLLTSIASALIAAADSLESIATILENNIERLGPRPV